MAPNLTRKKKKDGCTNWHSSHFPPKWDANVNSIIANRRLSWTQVDYTVLMGHVSFLSNAIPSIHAGRKCSCEIQSHLSEVKWESFPALPSSLAKTLIACPAFCSQAGLIPHRLGEKQHSFVPHRLQQRRYCLWFQTFKQPPQKSSGSYKPVNTDQNWKPLLVFVLVSFHLEKLEAKRYFIGFCTEHAFRLESL